MNLPNVLTGLGVNLLFAGIAFLAKSVTLSGALSGILLGTWIYSFLGPQGFSVAAGFFIVASLLTRWGYRLKKERGTAQRREGRRTYREGFANCAVGACFATLANFSGNFLYEVAFVASFATALADTTATELGSLYGRHPFLWPSLKKVPGGTPGALSLEGTLAGIVAALFLTELAFGTRLIREGDIWIIVVAATVGSVAESFLARGPVPVGHDWRNFLNTLIGALVAIGLWKLCNV